MFRHKKRNLDNELAKQQDINKSIWKDRQRFARLPTGVLLGTTVSGLYKKQSDKSDNKFYYGAEHPWLAYFALEILLLIGFNTPKARLQRNYPLQVMTKNILGFVPIASFYEKPITILLNPMWSKAHEYYQLDIEKQVIIEKRTGKEYKISGNLFATNIGGTLLHDLDLQPEKGNIGLVKIGNRFYAYLIDKEHVKITGNTYAENFQSCEVINEAALYRHTTQDQVLFIVSKVKQAFLNNDVSKIFYNKRISENIINDLKKNKVLENLNITISSLLEYYQIDDSFTAREKIREGIADQIINSAHFKGLTLEEREQIKENIMEDLRSPYYVELFANHEIISEADLQNTKLIDKILADQVSEMESLLLTDLYFSLKQFVSERNESSKQSENLKELLEDMEDNELFLIEPVEMQKELLKQIFYGLHESNPEIWDEFYYLYKGSIQTLYDEPGTGSENEAEDKETFMQIPSDPKPRRNTI